MFFFAPNDHASSGHWSPPSLGQSGKFRFEGTVGQPEKWQSQVWGTSQKPGDYILYCVHIYNIIYIYI